MANFGNRNDALILGLARGLTIQDAAEEAGYGRRTAYRRWADPGFRRQVSAVRGDLMDRAVGRLADSAVEAANTLWQLLGSDCETTRLAASRAILQQAAVLREAAELEQRIARLEQGDANRGDDTNTLGVA